MSSRDNLLNEDSVSQDETEVPQSVKKRVRDRGDEAAALSQMQSPINNSIESHKKMANWGGAMVGHNMSIRFKSLLSK